MNKMLSRLVCFLKPRRAIVPSAEEDTNRRSSVKQPTPTPPEGGSCIVCSSAATQCVRPSKTLFVICEKILCEEVVQDYCRLLGWKLSAIEAGSVVSGVPMRSDTEKVMYDEIILQAGAKRAILDHLASLHKHFCAADNYGSTAPFWKNLEREKILQWLLLHTSVLTKKPGISSVISNQDDTLIVLSVVDKTYRTAVRDAFKPGGYMGHLEQHGMFNAPQQRQAAAAFVIGHEYKAIYGRVDLCVHFAWLPPLDGHSYQVVVPQDIMTTEEKTTWLT